MKAKETILEAERTVEVSGRCDVFVAGAGPAGVMAALAAARRGAKVTLMDAAGCLGGVWTAGLLCYVIGADNKAGLVNELTDELDRRGARQGKERWAYDPEIMKRVLEQWCVDLGIQVQLHTRVVAVASSGGRLTHVMTESASGRQAWAAHTFIDCTGNGDLAARAGCAFEVGHPEHGGVQPMSFPVLVTGIEYEEVKDYMARIGDTSTDEKPAKRRQRLTDLCRSLGAELTYPQPMLVQIHDNLFSLICDHQFGHRSDDAAAITQATINGRREVHAAIDALRSSGGVWENLRLVATCEHIGVREGRRIQGRATITYQDIIDGRVPKDSIAICTFGFDVHSVKKNLDKAYNSTGYKAQPYGLPLSSLIARDLDGLMMAGRCISGDFFAHSSYRVTGDAAAMGQAAGVCAARAAAQGVLPQEVDFADVVAGLRNLGAPVPGEEALEAK